jgi:hypothetical protein
MRWWVLPILMAVAPATAAATFHRDGMCDNFKLLKRGVDMVIICPTWPNKEWLVIEDIYLRCGKVSASLRKTPTPLLTITCSGARIKETRQ